MRIDLFIVLLQSKHDFNTKKNLNQIKLYDAKELIDEHSRDNHNLAVTRKPYLFWSSKESKESQETNSWAIHLITITPIQEENPRNNYNNFKYSSSTIKTRVTTNASNFIKSLLKLI